MPRRIPPLSLALALAAVAMSAPTAALAQNADDLVRQGIEARQQGDDARAVELFEQAFAESESPRALAQLALAEQAIGRWVDAHDHLSAALEADHEWIAKHREVLQTALEEIHEHVGELEVRGSPEGAEVRVQGRAIGTLPMSEPATLAVGTALVEVHAEGHVPSEREVRIEAGALAREQVGLARRPPTSGDDGPEAPPSNTDAAAGATLGAPASPTGSDDEGRRARLFGWTAIAAGGVAIAGGTVAWARRESIAREYNGDDCISVTAARDELCGGKRDKVGRLQAGAAAGLALGGVLAGAGATLLLTGWPGGGKSRDPERAVRCSPTAGRSWGLACRGAL